MSWSSQMSSKPPTTTARNVHHGADAGPPPRRTTMRSTMTLDGWHSQRTLRTILAAIAAPGYSARHENPYPRTRRSAHQGASLVSLRTQSRRRSL